jgi:hypothetical protein
MIVYKRGGNLIRKSNLRMTHMIHRGRSKDYRGHGIFDFFKPAIDLVKTIATNRDLAGQIGKTAVDVFNIGRNTKNIITSLRNKKAQIVQQMPEAVRPAVDAQLEDVLNRINKLKMGTGFRRQ